jgi:hypothetical protein
MEVFGEVGEGGLCGAEVVSRREDELEAALAGGDGDHIEELDGLIGEGGEGLLCGEYGDAAAYVTGERLDVLERCELQFAGAGDGGELLEIELLVAGDDGEEVVVSRGTREQCLEDLFGGKADLASDGDRGEVVGVDA